MPSPPPEGVPFVLADFTEPSIRRKMKEIEAYYECCQKQRKFNLDTTGKIHPHCLFVDSKLVLAAKRRSAAVFNNLHQNVRHLKQPIQFVYPPNESCDVPFPLPSGKYDARPVVGHK